MTPAEIFYVGGMTLISIAFPTLLVGFWAFDRARPRAIPVPASEAHPVELRRAA